MEFLSIIFLLLTIIAIVLCFSALVNRRRIRKGKGVSKLGYKMISSFGKRVTKSGREAGRNLKIQGAALALFSLLFIGNVFGFIVFLILPFLIVSLYKAWDLSNTPAEPDQGGGAVGGGRPGRPSDENMQVQAFRAAHEDTLRNKTGG